MSQNKTDHQNNSQPLPSLPELAKATVFALIVAAIVLVVAILPAEYAIDPTGAGAALGLTQLNVDNSEPDSSVEPDPLSDTMPTVIAATTAGTWNSDQISIVLEPYEDGVELKALMQKGEQLVFSWQTDGAPVFVDMHGEEPDAGEHVFTSYWKEKQQSDAQGLFIAPFSGTHGWYWQNTGAEPVTVTLNISGFYQKLLKP